jgi:hypothetical protein
MNKPSKDLFYGYETQIGRMHTDRKQVSSLISKPWERIGQTERSTFLIVLERQRMNYEKTVSST